MLDGFLAMAGLATAAGVWGVAIEPRLLRICRHRIASPRWPRHWPALKVAVLSDLHAAWPHVDGRRIERLVARILAERPDLVLLPGDFVSTRALFQRPLAMPTIAAALAPLTQVPVVATLGNHDYEHGGREVAAALRAVGIEVLYDSASQLPWADGTVQLAGIPYSGSGRFDPRTALLGLDLDRPLIVTSHTPDAFPQLPDKVMLTVAGHTHGGQVVLPGLPPPVTFSRLPRRLARGLHRDGERFLYVSAGVGMSGPPIRFGVPPEIGLLTIGGDAATSPAPGSRSSSAAR